MLDRAGQVLRIVCIALAVWLLYDFTQMALRVNPLANVVIPSLPTLPATNKNLAAEIKKPTDTNKMASEAGTNSHPHHHATNDANAEQTKTTNSGSMADADGGTNAVRTIVKNLTNNAIATLPAVTTNDVGATVASTLTNAVKPIDGTNSSVADKAPKPRIMRKGTPPDMAMMGMGMGMSTPELPPDVKARVDRIYESEILAQAMRPLPMGLIGIGGDLAVLRTASGQTGMIKEGESLGDLKLLQIGINRVLVEQGGEKKELTIFDGYGGKSLLPEKGKN